MAMGHVILKEFYFPRAASARSAYFDDYVPPLTPTCRCWSSRNSNCRRRDGDGAPTATCAPPTFADALGATNNPEWKTVAFDDNGGSCCPTARSVSAGADGRADGQMEPRSQAEATRGKQVKPLSLT